MLTPEKIREDVSHLRSDELIPYVISRLEEFNNLRKHFEKDIDILKDELRRVGRMSDVFIANELPKRLAIRDSWWKTALQDASGVGMLPTVVAYPTHMQMKDAVQEYILVLLENIEEVKQYVFQRLLEKADEHKNT